MTIKGKVAHLITVEKAGYDDSGVQGGQPSEDEIQLLWSQREGVLKSLPRRGGGTERCLIPQEYHRGIAVDEVGQRTWGP